MGMLTKRGNAHQETTVPVLGSIPLRLSPTRGLPAAVTGVPRLSFLFSHFPLCLRTLPYLPYLSFASVSLSINDCS